MIGVQLVSRHGLNRASAQDMRWRAYLLASATAACLGGEAWLGASDGRQATAASTDAAAIRRFDAAIANYIALRTRLLNEVHAPKPESTSTGLNQASDALAAAIQRSRRNARPGDLFVAPAAIAIKKRIVDTIQRENLELVLSNIDDEERGAASPRIHMRFPAAAAMATMPPSLLAVLPNLPKELEYRIVGEYLILRDVEAALVVDVISSAVPRRQF